MTDEHRNGITLSAMEGWKKQSTIKELSQSDNKKPEELSLTILSLLIRMQIRFSRAVTSISCIKNYLMGINLATPHYP